MHNIYDLSHKSHYSLGIKQSCKNHWYDLEVIVQGQRSPTMVCNTSSWADLQCNFMPNIKTQICTQKSIIWPWGHQLRYHLYVQNTLSWVDLSLSLDTICYEQTDTLMQPATHVTHCVQIHKNVFFINRQKLQSFLQYTCTTVQC